MAAPAIEETKDIRLEYHASVWTRTPLGGLLRRKTAGDARDSKGSKLAEFQLSEEERHELEALMRWQSTPGKTGADDPGSGRGEKEGSECSRPGSHCGDGAHVAHALGWSAGRLPGRSLGERPLRRSPRPGRPAQIAAEHACPMITSVCEQPGERPFAT